MALTLIIQTISQCQCQVDVSNPPAGTYPAPGTIYDFTAAPWEVEPGAQKAGSWRISRIPDPPATAA